MMIVVWNVLVSGFLVWRVGRAETGGRLCLDEGEGNVVWGGVSDGRDRSIL